MTLNTYNQEQVREIRFCLPFPWRLQFVEGCQKTCCEKHKPLVSTVALKAIYSMMSRTNNIDFGWIDVVHFRRSECQKFMLEIAEGSFRDKGRLDVEQLETQLRVGPFVSKAEMQISLCVVTNSTLSIFMFTVALFELKSVFTSQWNGIDQHWLQRSQFPLKFHCTLLVRVESICVPLSALAFLHKYILHIFFRTILRERESFGEKTRHTPYKTRCLEKKPQQFLQHRL